MSKKQSNKSSKKIEEKKEEVEKPKVEEVKKPVEEKEKVEEVKKPVEEVEKKEKKELRCPMYGMKIGNSIILSVYNKIVNRRTYKEVKTIDGVTFLLSEKDFEEQIVKENNK